MQGFAHGSSPFFGLTNTMLVIDGEDRKLPKGGNMTHAVYRVMLATICKEYSSLPDINNMDMVTIQFFYDALRGKLRESTRKR